MRKAAIKPGQANGPARVPVRLDAKTVIWVLPGDPRAAANYQEQLERSRSNKNRTPFIATK